MTEIDTSIWLVIGGIALLLMGSAFFSGSETALMSSRQPRLHKLEKEGHKGAARVTRLMKKPETLLSTILLGNNLVNIGASALATGLFIELWGESGIAAATVVMTFLVLIFSEILPKTIARLKPEAHAMWLSVPMSFFVFVLRPFTKMVRLISRGLMRLIGINPNAVEAFGEEDLRGAIGLGLETGVLEKREHRMLDSILELDEISVEDVMIHRSAMQTLDADLDPDAFYSEVVGRSRHSRLPVWRGNRDNIIGILHVKDYFRAHHDTAKTGKKFQIEEILQEPYFIPETAIVGEQLLEFRRTRRHIGLVVDEYGDIQGLVTLEDILEEIVGEIEDEHDITKASITHEPDGSLTLPGSFPVRDANRELGWKLDDEDAVTLAGLIMDKAERIPAVGETVEVDGIAFHIINKKRQAILRVNARPVAIADNEGN